MIFRSKLHATNDHLLRYILFHRNAPPEVKKACDWLVKHRLPDGGWGEKFESCEQKEYVAAETSQIVNTSWALLGLMSVRLVLVLIPGTKLSDHFLQWVSIGRSSTLFRFNSSLFANLAWHEPARCQRT